MSAQVSGSGSPENDEVLLGFIRSLRPCRLIIQLLRPRLRGIVRSRDTWKCPPDREARVCAHQI